jgi:hypothetical protein
MLDGREQHAQTSKRCSACCAACGPLSKLPVHVQVTVLVSTNCASAGEALRLIDQKHLIKNDFVLVRLAC